MGALANLDHERFCQALHKRIWALERRSTALTASYRETIYQGKNSDDAAIAPNARKLANRKDVAARLKELAAYAGKLVGIDSAWCMLKLKDRVEFNVDDFLGPVQEDGRRYYDLSKVPREKLELLAGLNLDQWERLGEEGNVVMRGIRVGIKPPDQTACLALMAKIAGWEAPKKIAPTTPSGEGLTLESLIGASYAAGSAHAPPLRSVGLIPAPEKQNA